MSIFKISLAAVLSVATVSTPVLAQSAAPLSLAGSVERAGASMSGAGNLDFEDQAVLGLGLIAIMTAIIVLSGGGGDNDFANSP